MNYCTPEPTLPPGVAVGSLDRAARARVGPRRCCWPWRRKRQLDRPAGVAMPVPAHELKSAPAESMNAKALFKPTNTDRPDPQKRPKGALILWFLLSGSADSATPAAITEIEPSGGCSVWVKDWFCDSNQWGHLGRGQGGTVIKEKNIECFHHPWNI